MEKLVRSHGELYLVDKDPNNRISIYAYIDYKSMDWISFIFCDSINPYRARKSIRLEYGRPVAVTPTHPIFSKTKHWDINTDGSDKILIDFLKSRNSTFPTHTNWERIRMLYIKHDMYHKGELWWKSKFYACDMPDYSNIWGMCNWTYLDNDPDNAHPVGYDEESNISIWSTDIGGLGLFVFDNSIRAKAKHAAKISIFAPEYMDYKPNDYECMKSKWVLPDGIKRKVIQILKRKSGMGGSNWEQAIASIDMAGCVCAYENGKQITSFYNIPDDLPMPDYMQLPE